MYLYKPAVKYLNRNYDLAMRKKSQQASMWAVSCTDYFLRFQFEHCDPRSMLCLQSNLITVWRQHVDVSTKNGVPLIQSKNADHITAAKQLSVCFVLATRWPCRHRYTKSTPRTQIIIISFILITFLYKYILSCLLHGELRLAGLLKLILILGVLKIRYFNISTNFF